jgi:tetratricopeptide (TPR) repeat protein
MTTSTFIVKFKQAIPEPAWSWTIAALHQDKVVWHELQAGLGIKALETFQALPDAYTPAALALLDLGQTDPWQILNQPPKQLAAWLSEIIASDTTRTGPVSKLSESCLAAIRLLDQYLDAGSWQGLAHDLKHISPATAACLYGLNEDPVDLLVALLEIDQPSLATHALLSNPLPVQAQTEILSRLQLKTPVTHSLRLLKALFIQRPVLAVGIAQENLKSAWWEQNKGQVIDSPNITLLDEPYRQIKSHLFRADMYCLAAQPNLALPILAETIKLARSMQAQIAARLALAAAEDEDRQGYLSAWEQASHLDPDSLDHLSGYLLALLDDNQPNEAETRLSEHPLALSKRADQPAQLLYAQASLSLHAGDAEKAAEFAQRSMEKILLAVEAHLPAEEIDQRLPVALARLFLEISLPQKAVQAARTALRIHPANVDACALLAQSLLASGQLDRAIDAAHLAVALSPDRLDLRQQLAEILEAAQEWQAAFVERRTLLERIAKPGPEHQYEYAESALRARHPEVTIQVCEHLLAAAEQDGTALAIYAKAIASQGRTDEAIELLARATQDAPSHPAAWLVLSQIYEEQDDAPKSLEILRSAYQAAPDEPQVLLALGEAYLATQSPTQALVPLRQAHSLVNESSARQSSHPLTSRIAFRLGQTLFQLGHMQDARQALELAYRSAPYNPEIAHRYAQVLLDLDDPQPALLPLQTVLQTEPADPQAYLDYARCVLSMDRNVEAENYQKALIYLDRAMEIDPRLPEARALSAEVLAASGDLLPAVNAYRKALDTRLAQDPSWQIRLWLGLGKVTLDLGQIETAIAALREASHAGPDNPDVQRFLCEAYDAAGLTDSAFEAAQTARDLAPQDIELLIWYAQKAHELDKKSGAHLPQAHQEAVQALEQATRLATDRADLLARLGDILLQMGETDAAHRTFRRLMGEGDDDFPGMHLDASSADLHKAALGLLELSDSAGGIACLERALQVHKDDLERPYLSRQGNYPSRLQLLTDLAIAYHRAGKLAASLQTIEQGIQLDKQRTQLYVMKAELLMQLAPMESTSEETIREYNQLALNSLETALDLDPGDASLHLRVAVVLRKMGETQDALSHAEQALLLINHSLAESGQYDALCAANLLSADLSRAMLQSSKAVEILDRYLASSSALENPHQAQIHCLRAELALESGDYERAVQEVAQAIELTPDDPGLLSLQVRLSLRKAEDPAKGYPTSSISSAADLFNLALAAFNKRRVAGASAAIITPELSVIDSQAAIRRRLIQTALEMHLWQPALKLAYESAQSLPCEPEAHLHLARALVLRGEYQRRCQALEVLAHAPGSIALSEEAFGEYQFAIQTGEGLILEWLDSHPEQCEQLPAGMASNDPLCLFKRWQARGAAVFCPNAQSAEALAELPTHPENIIAQIACLHEIGDLASAGRVASDHAHHPYVLAQLALALSESKPRQALVAAQGAIEAYLAPDESLAPETADSEWVAHKTDMPLLFVLLGKLLFQHGSTEDDKTTAIQAIGKALKIWPDEPRWNRLAAQIYLKHPEAEDSQYTQAAITHLEKSIQLEPDHPWAYQILGGVYEKQGLSNRAIAMFESAVNLAPEDVNLWLQLARIYLFAGAIEKATRCAEQAISLAPDQTSPLILRAQIDLEQDNPQEAYSRAQSALTIDPGNPEALLLVARALKAMDQPDKAIELLEKAIPELADPLPLNLEYIHLIHQAKGVKPALQVASELSNQYPNDPQVLSVLAKTLEEDGQINAAIQAAQRALRSLSSLDSFSNQDLACMHFHLGHLLSQAGQLDQAIHHLVEAIHIQPGYIEPYLELGRVHQQRRQHNQALKAFTQAIDAAPNDARPYYHAGVALKESKDYIQAEKMLRRASELAPEDISVHRLLGAVVALNLVHNRREPIITA